MLAYKIAGKHHRYGTNLTVFLAEQEDHERALLYLRNAFGDRFDDFFPVYANGATISRSTSLFLFDSKFNARGFLEELTSLCLVSKRAFKILSVEIIREAPVPRYILPNCAGNPRRMLWTSANELIMRPYYGTICAYELRVLS